MNAVFFFLNMVESQATYHIVDKQYGQVEITLVIKTGILQKSGILYIEREKADVAGKEEEK